MPKKPVSLAIVEDPQSPQVDANTLYQMLGAARYANHLSNQTKSDVIRFVKLVRDNKLFEQLGFTNLDDYLASDISPISQASFYREEKLFEKEGEQYDLFNEWKIPARIRKQLSSGDISIDGDEVVVGEERVSITQGGSIKAILEQLVKEKLAGEENVRKANEDLDREKRYRASAEERADELMEEVASLRNGTPYEQQLGDTIFSMLSLTEVIGWMDDKEKAEKGLIALPQLEAAIEKIAESYGLELFGGEK